MLYVAVVIVVVAVAVLVGVIAVAMGRGGELAYFQPDYAPLNLEEVSATDVALFRPPTALWGYSMQITDDALGRIANAITERDIEIATLQRQVADLEASAGDQRRPEPPGRPGPQQWGPPPEPSEPGDWGRPAEPGDWGQADEPEGWGPAARPDDWGTAAEPEDDEPMSQARSVWEPPHKSEARSATQWAALPKRTPGMAADDEDEE
jgi:hypothetical protein